jgi:hypothetical protein
LKNNFYHTETLTEWHCMFFREIKVFLQLRLGKTKGESIMDNPETRATHRTKTNKP